MKKTKKFTLRTMTDIKVFLLFLLDRIGYPIDHTSLIEMVSENTDEIIFDYDECLRELSDAEHIISDEVDGERYYMISDSGKSVASELYDTLDEEFRERSLRYAAKYASLSRTGVRIKATVTETEHKHYKVTMSATNEYEEYLNVSLVVKSRMEAEKIKMNFETKPDGLYRGVLFSATGRLEFISKF